MWLGFLSLSQACLLSYALIACHIRSAGQHGAEGLLKALWEEILSFGLFERSGTSTARTEHARILLVRHLTIDDTCRGARIRVADGHGLNCGKQPALSASVLE